MTIHQLLGRGLTMNSNQPILPFSTMAGPHPAAQPELGPTWNQIQVDAATLPSCPSCGHSQVSWSIA